MATVTLDDLHKSYAGREVVHGVSSTSPMASSWC